MKIDLTLLQKEIDDGWVSVSKHPTLPLSIYKYTIATPFARHWNDITTLCRGIVLDDSGNVIVNAIPKFYNHNDPCAELESKTGLDYVMTDKADGSLVQVALYNDNLIVTSSGSFVSPQVQKALSLIKLHNFNFMDGYTYVFEIIYPENRIVLDYGDTERMILITIRDNKTGQELNAWESDFLDTVKPITLSIDTIVKELKRPDYINKEGYIVKFSDGSRVKFKYDEYLRLHTVVSGVNEKWLWGLLVKGQSYNDFLNNIPDELFDWCENYTNNLKDQYLVIENYCEEVYEKLITLSLNRKEFADKVITYHKNMAYILFLMYDNDDYSEAIWKSLYPEKITNFGRGDG